MAAKEPWRNRIVGHGEQPAISFMANPLNWRIHPKAQREALTGVLSEVGWVQSVIVNRTTGHVVDGHARIEEALKLGDETLVPFVEVELTEDEEAKILLTLDPISAMAAADKANLDALLHDVSSASAGVQSMLSELAEKNGLEYGATIGGELEDIEPQVDRAEELRQKWGVESGQIWQLGDHRLMCGDSTNADDVARLMNGEKAEIVFTSPPYADIRDYKGGDLSVDAISEFITAFSSHSKYQVVNLGLKRSDGEVVEYWQQYISRAKKCELKLLAWNVWSRHGFGGSIGNMTAMFPIEHEWIFVFGKQAKQTNETIKNKTANASFDSTIRMKSGETKKHSMRVGNLGHLGSVFVSDVARGEKDHPAMFPIDFPVAYIEAMTGNGDVVAEPFSGGGTTIMAAERLERKCYAMEIAPAYVAVALERWSQATGKTPVLCA